jgi:hypothetical protein
MSEYNQSFASETEWICKGRSWLTRHPRYGQFFKAICFDSAGMICLNGGDFKRAKYPVHYVWPDENLFEAVERSKPTASGKGEGK